MVPFAELLDLRDPKKSKAAATSGWVSRRRPSPRQVSRAPTGYTRPYSMHAKTKRADEAWKLMQFLGGKDAKGEYYFPKRFFIDLFRGYGYKVLDNDPEVQRAARRAVGRRPGHHRRGQPARQAAAGPEGPVVLRVGPVQYGAAPGCPDPRSKPQDALADSARKARELAKG